MTLVDREGRLFGRLNLVDAVVVTVVLGLIPLGFVAYRLFRTPAPVLTEVEPDVLNQGANLRVMIHGLNLRPYMRVSFNAVQGRSFLFDDSTKAQVELRDAMPPDVYDVVLYDQWQERARLPKAFTIRPAAQSPTVRMVVVGTVTINKPEDVQGFKAGEAMPDVGDLLQVGKPGPAATRVRSGPTWVEVPQEKGLRLPLSLLVPCRVGGNDDRQDCVALGRQLEPNALVSLATPLGARPFLIDEVRSPAPLSTVQIRVRFTGDPGALSQIRPGDLDLGASVNELATRSTVVSTAAVNRRSNEEATRDVDLTVQVQRASAGWTFLSRPLRIGAAFALRTALYDLTGQVIALSPPPTPAPNAAR